MTGEIPATIGGSKAGSFVFLSFPPSYPGMAAAPNMMGVSAGLVAGGF